MSSITMPPPTKNVYKDVVLKLIVITVPLYYPASVLIVLDKHSSFRFETQSNPNITEVVDYDVSVNGETNILA